MTQIRNLRTLRIAVKKRANMTKKLTSRALARFEAGRDIWQEVLDGVREIKSGRGKRRRSRRSVKSA
jgi:hypothetical protein